MPYHRFKVGQTVVAGGTRSYRVARWSLCGGYPRPTGARSGASLTGWIV
jgi:hypothetical protein